MFVANPSSPPVDPGPVCCMAMEASCLACQAQLTVGQFCAGSPGTDGCPCQHLHNQDVTAGTFEHYGLDYNNSPSDEECSATCTANSECTAWVRQPSTGRCFISRQSVVTFEADTDRTTGLRCDAASPQCSPVSTATADAGYADGHRGWYDVQGCGECNDYCRWVGNSGSGGDPASGLLHGSSWWSCRLAGGHDNYSPREHFTSWSYTKCN